MTGGHLHRESAARIDSFSEWLPWSPAANSETESSGLILQIVGSLTDLVRPVDASYKYLAVNIYNQLNKFLTVIGDAVVLRTRQPRVGQKVDGVFTRSLVNIEPVR